MKTELEQSADRLVFHHDSTPQKATKMLAFGLVVLALSAGAYFAGMKNSAIANFFVGGMILGGFFTAISILSFFYRAKVELDRSDGTGLRWSGILRPMSTTAFALEDVEYVWLTHPRSPSRPRADGYYSVHLKGLPNGVGLAWHSSYKDARAQAEAVARFLERPLHERTGVEAYDETGAPKIAREAAAVDESAGERASRAGTFANWPPPPEDCRIEVAKRDGAMAFTLPVQRGAGNAYLIAGSIAALGTGVLVWFIARMVSGVEAAMLPMYWFLPVGAAAFTAYVLFVGIDRAKRQERIELGRKVLRYTRRNVITRSAHEMGTARIEQFGYSHEAVEFAQNGEGTLHAGALVARSDTGTLQFAAGLTRSEQAWLHDTIVAALSGLAQTSASPFADSPE